MQTLFKGGSGLVPGIFLVLLAGGVLATGAWGARGQEATAPHEDVPTTEAAYDEEELSAPIRLTADGQPIDIGKLSTIAHAGPWIADVDGDGDQDLLVGDFPGYFWFFENTADDVKPTYTSKGKLKAGGEAAKTPVY